MKEHNGNVPPHSIPAEQSVLGGLMLNNDAWDKVIDILCCSDFYTNSHRLIFTAIEFLQTKDKSVDVLTVSDYLKNINELDNAGGEGYLFELSNNTPSISNIATYAGIVKDKSILRQIISKGTEIIGTAFNPELQSATEILDVAQREMMGIAETNLKRDGAQPIIHHVTKAFKRLADNKENGLAITGISTGFHELDDITCGLQPSDLIILAARPSMGKTTLALNIVAQVSISQGLRSLVFSMEMPGEQLISRLFSSTCRINLSAIRSGTLNDGQWASVSKSVDKISAAPITIDDRCGLSPAQIKSSARKSIKEYGKLDLIVIDYLQQIKIPGYKQDQTAETTEISRSLKTMARELDVPVIAISQLNRELEKRQDKRPIPADLRQSGALEQDADLIMFVYRDEVYNENTPDKGKAELIIAKHRNGPIGKIDLAYFGHFSLFENLPRKNY